MLSCACSHLLQTILVAIFASAFTGEISLGHCNNVSANKDISHSADSDSALYHTTQSPVGNITPHIVTYPFSNCSMFILLNKLLTVQ